MKTVTGRASSSAKNPRANLRFSAENSTNERLEGGVISQVGEVVVKMVS